MQNCVHYSCLVGQFISDLRNCALSCFITQMNLNAVKLFFLNAQHFINVLGEVDECCQCEKNINGKEEKDHTYDGLIFWREVSLTGNAVLAMIYCYHWYCQH